MFLPSFRYVVFSRLFDRVRYNSLMPDNSESHTLEILRRMRAEMTDGFRKVNSDIQNLTTEVRLAECPRRGARARRSPYHQPHRRARRPPLAHRKAPGTARRVTPVDEKAENHTFALLGWLRADADARFDGIETTLLAHGTRIAGLLQQEDHQQQDRRNRNLPLTCRERPPELRDD